MSTREKNISTRTNTKKGDQQGAKLDSQPMKDV